MILLLTILISQGCAADDFITSDAFETLLVPFLSSAIHCLGKVNSLTTPGTLGVGLAQF